MFELFPIRSGHRFNPEITGSMRALWQRCIGMARNAGGIVLTNLVYNMMRFEQIVRLRIVYPAAARA